MVYATDYVDVLGDTQLEYPTQFSLIKELFVGSYLEGGISRATLERSIDGDTARFILEGETSSRSFRFVGIDTPETFPVVEPWGLEAKAYTDSVIENATEIWISKDPNTSLFDSYGRNLGLIWVDGVLLNYELVRLGYSKNNYSDPNFTLVFENVSLDRWFKNAEAEAKANALNIWS
jgi:micrococcal nuclease